MADPLKGKTFQEIVENSEGNKEMMDYKFNKYYRPNCNKNQWGCKSPINRK